VWTRIDAHQRHRRWLIAALAFLSLAAVVGVALWSTMN
jgi:hypothetical protein